MKIKLLSLIGFVLINLFALSVLADNKIAREYFSCQLAVPQLPANNKAFLPQNMQIAAYQSPYDVNHTVKRLIKLLKQNNMQIFAQINYSADAKKADLHLLDEQLIIFGNPKAGTMLLQENALIGLALPLKILVWQPATGFTQIAYIIPSSIATNFGLQASAKLASNMDNGLAAIFDKFCDSID